MPKKDAEIISLRHWIGTKKDFILSVDPQASVHEVVKIGKSRGVHLTPAQVHTTRWQASREKNRAKQAKQAKQVAQEKPKAKAKPPAHPRPAARARRRRSSPATRRELKKAIQRLEHPDVHIIEPKASRAPGAKALLELDAQAENTFKMAVLMLGLNRAGQLLADIEERTLEGKW